MLKPPQCAIVLVPPHKGFTLPAMMVIVQKWNLYKHTKSRDHCNNYKLLKDVLINPRRRGLGEPEKLRCGPFLKNALTHITDLQTHVKARQEPWNIFELM